MIRPGRFFSAAVLLGVALIVTQGVSADSQTSPFQDISRSTGHFRGFETSRGPIYVWTPAGHNPQRSGIVVYVHGYYVGTEEAWQEHRLAEQFAASGRDALFIVPEAPSDDIEPVRWPNLDELFAVVRARLGGALPKGPLIVAGHSGAYRTMVKWTGHPRVRSFVLLDTLYRGARSFRRWLHGGTKAEPRQMFVVSLETLGVAEPLARSTRGAVCLDRVPERLEDFEQGQRRACLIEMKSQYEHMELVESGKVLPLLLQLTPLPALEGTALIARR